MAEATEAAGDGAVVAYLGRLFSATRIEQAWALHLRRMAAFGFDRVIYSNARLSGSVGVLEDTLILSNHDRSFLDPFLSSGMWRGGIFIRHAETIGRLSVPWRVTPEIDLSDEDRRILEFRAAHGVVAGCSLSFRGYITQGRAGMGLCASRDIDQDGVEAIWERHGPLIEVLSVAFHLRVASLPLDLPGRALSPRQREVLRWASDGMTVQEIAQRMGLAGPTVEKHLRLARVALGVQTTTQAVLKATFLNQLFRVEVTVRAPPEAGTR
jgi:LuxR family transcriptional regulator